MSSYLVALAVGDFVCNEGIGRWHSDPHLLDPRQEGLTGFALESTQEIVSYYNRYYYDQISVQETRRRRRA